MYAGRGFIGRKSKFGNRRTEVDGITFSSQKEAFRYGELRLLERLGKITELELQPKFSLMVLGVRICGYVGDFKYREAEKRICEDVKGYQTPDFKLKWKLVKVLFPDIEFILT